MNKVIQDQKVEVETIEKSQMEANLEIENLGKKRKKTRNYRCKYC